MAGLYVHVPFRRAHRPYDESYCVPTDASEFTRFETALCQELTYYAQEYATDEPMTTVYAGGGRPSLLPLSSVHSILTTLIEVFDASGFEEATAEVNPADATTRYLHGLKRMGFDRLSLRLLSFFPSVLRSFDAPHSAADAIRALQTARETGFDTLSVDLLFGGPHQSIDIWEATLRQTIEMGVPHVTITEVPTEAAPETDKADQMDLAMRLLRSEGYKQYELTHFALPGHRSVHQENYYDHGNYLGIGPSAESFWWPHRSAPKKARRWSNVGDVERYADLLRQRYSPAAYCESLNQTSLAQEYVFLRLRTDAGVDLDRLKAEYDLDLRSQNAATLARLQEEGLIHDEDRVRLTRKGRLMADAVTRKLLPS